MLNFQKIQTIAFIIFFSSPSWAGQIHYQDILISQISLTVLVQFLNEVEPGKTIKAKIIKLWRNPSEPGVPFNARAPEIAKTWQPGLEVTFTLRPPYNWSDPEKSPLAESYWDGTLQLPKKNEKLFLLASFGNEFEMSSYTLKKEQKFELFSDSKMLAAHLEKITVAELIALFTDKDFRPLSLAQLQKRKVPANNLLIGQTERNAFLEVLQFFYYNKKENVSETLQAFLKSSSQFSDEQNTWFASWINTHLKDPNYWNLKADFFTARHVKSVKFREEVKQFKLDFYGVIESLTDKKLIAKLTDAFFSDLDKNPEYVGDSFNGSLLERFMKISSEDEVRILRMRFLSTLKKCSLETKLEMDPDHLLMYFLISHLDRSQDSNAIDEFAKINFKNEKFKKFLQYAINLIIEDELRKGTKNKDRVNGVMKLYPEPEFLTMFDKDKKHRYEEFVK